MHQSQRSTCAHAAAESAVISKDRCIVLGWPCYQGPRIRLYTLLMTATALRDCSISTNQSHSTYQTTAAELLSGTGCFLLVTPLLQQLQRLAHLRTHHLPTTPQHLFRMQHRETLQQLLFSVQRGVSAAPRYFKSISAGSLSPMSAALSTA